MSYFVAVLLFSFLPVCVKLSQHPFHNKAFMRCLKPSRRAIAAPLPILGGMNGIYPHRIQNHVSAYVNQLVFFLHQYGFIAPLKNVSNPIPCIRFDVWA
jgi:hypothetical protein